MEEDGSGRDAPSSKRRANNKKKKSKGDHKPSLKKVLRKIKRQEASILEGQVKEARLEALFKDLGVPYPSYLSHKQAGAFLIGLCRSSAESIGSFAERKKKERIVWDTSELESRTRFKRKKTEKGSDSQEAKYARYFSGIDRDKIFHYLPEEITVRILTLLPFEDLLNASLTCRNMRSICCDNMLWKQFYTRKFGRSKTAEQDALQASWKEVFMKNNWGQYLIKQQNFEVTKYSHMRGYTCIDILRPRLGTPKRNESIASPIEEDPPSPSPDINDNNNNNDDNDNDNTKADPDRVKKLGCIITAQGNGWVRVYSAEITELAAIKAHRGRIWWLVSGPNYTCVTAGADGVVKIVDLLRMRVIRTLTGQNNPVWVCHFSIKDDIVLSGSEYGRVIGHSYSTGEIKFLFKFRDGIWDLKCLRKNYPNHALVTVLGGGVFLFSIETQKIVATFDGHTRTVVNVEILGDVMITTSVDFTCKVWDLKSKSMLASFAVRGHPFTMDLHQNLLFIGVTGEYDSTSVTIWDRNSNSEWFSIQLSEKAKRMYGLKVHDNVVYCCTEQRFFTVTFKDPGTARPTIRALPHPTEEDAAQHDRCILQ